MTALRRPDGTVTSSRRAIEKLIHDLYSDLFDSHVHLPPRHLPQDGCVVPPAFPYKIRHTSSMEKSYSARSEGVRSKHLNNLPPLYENGDVHDIATLVRSTLFTRAILNRICTTSDEENPWEQAAVRRGFSTTYIPKCCESTTPHATVEREHKKVKIEGSNCIICGLRVTASVEKGKHSLSIQPLLEWKAYV
ncbi:unnamed protein product [Heligmosomoides polygyrus]|uniref:RING-type domain-containing protein n=1 Tax=Heligmosomoides polygyrus TaxID=6339 RepID=A0A183F9K6_HELPZ|nr:unnamed protein product [Heligmosomoides polygyrus]